MAVTPTKNPLRSAIFMVLFSLPFAGVGIGMTGWAAWCAWQFRAMQSWVETPAMILQAEIENGGDSEKVTAVYEYNFDGKEHVGDRVTVHAGSDNIGSFHRDVHRELEQHRATKRPFRCFVNPNDPHDAILYRNLRWEMMAFYTLFGTLFGSAGFGILSATLLGWRDEVRSTSAPAPEDQPWTARADWAAGVIRETSGARLAGPILAILAVYWMIASFPLLSTLPELISTANSNWAYLTLAFPAVGVLLMTFSSMHYSRRRKYGDSVFEMAATPGVIGGQLAGVVRIPTRVEAPEGFLIKLDCLEKRDSDDGGDKVLWQDERLVGATLDSGPSETLVPILLAIPFECEETNSASVRRSIEWKLTISAQTSGVGYKSQFEVPVFETPESKPGFQLDEQLVEDFGRDPEPNRLLSDAGIFLESTADRGIRMIFTAGRNRGTAIGLTVFAMIWAAFGWLPWHLGAPIIFPMFMGLAWVVLLYAAFDAWFSRSVVEASPQGIVVRSGWFGMGRMRRFATDDLAAIEFKERYSNNNTHQIFRNLIVVLHNGKKRTLAKSIGSRMVERAILKQLNLALGRSHSHAR